MTPATFTLEVYRGDTASWSFVLWNDIAQTDPVDLTGATVSAEIRLKPGATPAVPLSCAVTLPNTVDVVLAPADSAQLPMVGVWDLRVTYPWGPVETFVAGAVLVTPDVTGGLPI